MKVSELVALLQNHSPDSLVYVDGYESGLEDVVSIRVVRVQRDTRSEGDWWEGKHSLSSDSSEMGCLLCSPRTGVSES